MTVKDSDIRKHLDHGVGNRRVVVQRNGKVYCYGSTDPVDRQHDWWSFGGWRSDLVLEVNQEREHLATLSRTETG